MAAVDLNADLGEREAFGDVDRGVIAVVTSVSIACGFHAGSRRVMRETASACAARGVAVGAHVAYRDRAGFGRRPVAVEPDRLAADVEEQCEALVAAADEVGAAVAYVKPHGALYHAMGADEEVAAAVVSAVAAQPHRTLVAQPGTRVVALAEAAGVRVVVEAFPDRGYLADGRLAPRHRPGALVADPDEAARRALTLVRDGGVPAVDGTWVAVAAETLCVHGDHPDADRRARAVRDALDGAGIPVRAFAASRSGRAPD